MGQGTQGKNQKNQQATSNTATLKQLAFIAALLVLIAAGIGLYIAYDDLTSEDNVEIII
ncbi:hypothetical protein PVOR_19389 [Paenibacillus vortex V453]|uniref:Uncharacterized protein n=1 Tax=Paenibacillus vortex V453 TaxID=715225 RepID=A0A2R9SSG2_9BACL|nr:MULTISPECIES: hypothetical protein [Paenibacillus]EFU40296.1 hypothetical protein PVOR_19389 [Paenibacillus vortex V453]MDH6674841.1 hypothetical protein [Paenibacillus sp. LBL]